MNIPDYMLVACVQCKEDFNRKYPNQKHCSKCQGLRKKKQQKDDNRYRGNFFVTR